MIPDPIGVADLGLAVFPLQPGSKLVYAPGWQTTATSDTETLRATWRPGDNLGVGCWMSRILGVDLDVGKEPGVDGIGRFAALCERHGAAWPDTLTIRTPSGGLHLYLAVPDGIVIGSTAGRSPRSPLGPGIDTRGPGRGSPPRGGYLVGPGSLVDGKAYTVERAAPIAECPSWLAELLALDPRPPMPVRRRPARPVPSQRENA